MVRKYKCFKTKNISSNKTRIYHALPYDRIFPLTAPFNLIKEITSDKTFQFPTVSELETYLGSKRNPFLTNPVSCSNKLSITHQNSLPTEVIKPPVSINTPPNNKIRKIQIKLTNLPIKRPNPNNTLTRIKFQIKLFK